MIDFLTIKEKFPKSHKELLEWMHLFGNYNGYDYDWINFNLKFGTYSFKDRDLYDFFDKEGVIIEITYHNHKEFVQCYFKHFITIWDELEGKKEYFGEECFQSRHSAESAAFNKSFELLEEKLTKI